MHDCCEVTPRARKTGDVKEKNAHERRDGERKKNQTRLTATNYRTRGSKRKKKKERERSLVYAGSVIAFSGANLWQYVVNFYARIYYILMRLIAD